MHPSSSYCNWLAVRAAVLQAMAKLPEMQAAMVEYFTAHSERAGQGLELLPGVKELLLVLKVG